MVGVINIGLSQGALIPVEAVNGLMAQPPASKVEWDEVELKGQ